MSGTLCIPAGALRGRDLSKVTPAQLEALAMDPGGRIPVPVCPPAVCRLPKDGRSYHTEGVPNGLEADYAVYLDTLLFKRGVLFWAFEKIRLTLADRTTLLPDFFVVTAEGKAEFHETKGFWREDARAKIKMAAQQFPCFVFKSVQKGKEGWKYEPFTPTGVREQSRRA